MKSIIIILSILLFAILSITGCLTTNTPTDSDRKLTGSPVLVVDALLPLTGSYSSFGEMAKASLLTSEEDINRYYLTIGSNRRVNVVIHDTGSDPATALHLARQVHSEGRKILLGHMTSAEVEAIKEYTDKNGMVVLDAGSTSPALAIPDDSIYRLISDDTAQGRVMGTWLVKNNISVVVPLSRGDIWGEGLLNATRIAFSDRKGVTLDGIRIEPSTTEYNASVQSLDILTGEAIETYGAEQVGVYLIGFDESANILREASVKKNLSRVRWFGCDGNTGITSLTGLAPAALFAARVNMTGTVWGNAQIVPLNGPKGRIRERLGYLPASGPMSLYDALWVVKDIFTEIPSDAGQAQIESVLVRHMSTYDGETGSLLMNTAGDRSLASYDVMKVTAGPKGSFWNKVAHVNIWPDSREEIIFEN